MIAAALVLLVAAAPKPEAQALLERIAEAQEDYRLREFYATSRAFLARFPRHPEVDRVRYELALQMVSESLTQPRSSTAAEARALLEKAVKKARSEDRKFDAALLLMKFSPEEERQLRSDEMLRRFPRHRSLDQVYFWRIEQALMAKDVVRAAKDAEALLRRWPKTEDASRYRRLITRAGLVGKPIPWRASDLAELGQKLEGKVVLVDFFATWCRPCVDAVPHLVELAKAHPEVQVVGVSVGDSEEALAAYLAEAKLPWPVLRSDDAPGTLADRCGVGELPIYLLTDARGRVVHTELRGESLDRALAAPR